MTRPPQTDFEPMLTVEEAAVALKVCTRTVRRWINAKQLPVVRLGRQYRVRRRDLELFVRDRWSG
jgi:excisionase family DNA binding protein